MAIPTGRIIDKLDSYYASNNLKGAEDLLTYWEEECRKQGDNGGLLTISNEQIGFYRRNKNDKIFVLPRPIKLAIYFARSRIG